MSERFRADATMKDTFAIAIAKVRGKTKSSHPEPRQSEEIDEGISRAWLGLLLFVGAFVGGGGFLCLLVGILHSGGVMEFLRKWLTALGGI